MTPRYARCLIVLGLIGSAAAARAQDTPDRVALHGFGSWAYGNTTWNNHYLSGRPEGDFRHISMTINAAANVDDKFTAHAQAELRDDDDRRRTTLSYAFADYRFSDRIGFRIGQVKHPSASIPRSLPLAPCDRSSISHRPSMGRLGSSAKLTGALESRER